jgi:outer membrane protein TolC
VSRQLKAAGLLALGAALCAFPPAHVSAQSAGQSAGQSADTLDLSLGAAVARAIARGDEVRIAETQTDIADAEVVVARAAGLPQLRLNAGHTHVMESARARAVGQIFNQPNTYSSSLSISQPVFQGGRVIASARAARRVRSASRFEESETRDQVAFDVQRAYLQTQFAQRLIEIQGESYRLAGERVTLAEQMLAAGRAARYDVLRARVEQANLEPLLIQARSDADQAELELKRLVNLPATQPLRLTTTIDTALIARMVARAESVEALHPDAAADRRPAVRAADDLARARRDGIAVARADYLPTIGVSAQLGYLAFPASGFPSGLGRLEPVPCPPDSPPERVCTQQDGGWFPDRSVGVTVSWPLFQGMRTRGNVALARAQADLATLQLAQTRERASVEFARARDELARARAVYAARRETVAEAEEAFRLASLRFARGLTTQLEVSDAQLALTTTQTTEARARYDLYLAAAALTRAAGVAPVPDESFLRAR